MFQEPVTVAIAGCGSRGKDNYAPCAVRFPDEMKIVAVADVRPQNVAFMRDTYHIPEENCFPSAEELLAQPKLADLMLISTMDRQHRPHAIQAMEQGYDILLEKPIAASPEDCLAVQAAAQRMGRTVVVCHVLRYTPFYLTVKRIIDSGELGDVVSVNAQENIGYYHFAHSYVRGNWRRLDETGPLVLTKCCHDLDLLLWLTGKHCESVSSFGSLKYFRSEAAPEGTSMRCLDGKCACKKDCPYDAEKIYLDPVRKGSKDWPANVVVLDPTVDSVTEALRNGPYGRCVFHSDNDVCDHQTVALQLEDNVNASLTICAFSDRIFREMRVMGTRGELEGDMDSNLIRVCHFGDAPRTVDIRELNDDLCGHGGGDYLMVHEVLELINAKKNGEVYENPNITGIDRSVESHLAAFAAEESRLRGGAPVSMKEFAREHSEL